MRVIKKIIRLGIVLMSSYIFAQYQSYKYEDIHNTRTQMKDSVSFQKVNINANLHVRTIDSNSSRYFIFWFKDDNRSYSKNDININSIFAPFIVKSPKKGFEIKSIKVLSKDKNIKKQLIAIVDALQYRTDESGKFSFYSALGLVDTNQTKKSNIYYLSHLRVNQQSKLHNDIKYIKSKIIIKSNNLWKDVTMHEVTRYKTNFLNSSIIDTRDFHLTVNKDRIPKNHWFMMLSTNIDSWGFKKGFVKIDKKSAEKLFSLKYQELLDLTKNYDTKEFSKWVIKNLDFLSNLSTLLQEHTFDDNVIENLFAHLGYIDRVESVDILSDVILNNNLNDKLKFRAIMALKNSSAPIDEALLDDLIEYGLGQSNDIIQQASGMMLGTLAKKSIDRAPEQYNKIANSIADALVNSEDKKVAINAARNMGTSANDTIVSEIEEIILNDNNSENKIRALESLYNIKRSNLSTYEFKDLLQKEKDYKIKAQIIRSSTVANDFNSIQYKNFLKEYVSNRHNSKDERLATLDALEKMNFGRTKEEKIFLRKLMVGEKDYEISLKLRKMYRR